MANVFGGNTAYIPDGEMGRSLDDNTPMVAAGALRPGSQNSSYHENPFFTPHERLNRQLSHQDIDGRDMEPTAVGGERDMAYRPSFNSISDDDRPPTPFMPGLMRKPVPARQQSENPFASPEDREAEDVVSPIATSKSFEQMNSRSPMIHYPSMSEVSEFDFAGEGRNSGSTGGGNRWYPAKERLSGRHELA